VVDLTEITDLEAAQFAKDIIAVLRDAGWKVNVGIMSTGAPRYGVDCFLIGASKQGEALAAVMRNLPTVRIIPGPHPPHPASIGVPHIASIFVGQKPPP
jgi:hypothetical protein